MKKPLKFFLIVASFLVFLTLIANYWFFHVDLDETKVQNFIKNFESRIPKLPVDDKNRVVGFKNAAELFNQKREHWTPNEKEAYNTFKEKILSSDSDEDFFKEISPEITAHLENTANTLIPIFLNSAQLPEGVFSNWYELDHPSEKERHENVLQLFNLSDFTLLYAHSLVLKKNWESVWPILRANLTLAEDFSRAPTAPLHTIMGQSILSRIYRWLGNIVEAGMIPKEQLAAFQDLVEVGEKFKKQSVSFKALFESQLFLMHHFSQSLINASEQKPFSLSQWWDKKNIRLAMQIVTKAYFEMLEVIDSDKPYQEKKLSLQQISEGYKKQLGNFASLLEGSNFSNMFENFVTQQVKLNTGPLLLALAKFFQKSTTFPNSISELISQGDLKEIPEDLFSKDKSALHYQRQGTGFIIYSVGPDGIDQNGKEDDIVIIGPPSASQN